MARKRKHIPRRNGARSNRKLAITLLLQEVVQMKREFERDTRTTVDQ